LAGLCEDGADRRGVNGLPTSLAEWRLSSFPEAASDLAGNHGVHHREFNVMVPDPSVVIADPVIDLARKHGGGSESKAERNDVPHVSHAKHVPRQCRASI